MIAPVAPRPAQGLEVTTQTPQQAVCELFAQGFSADQLKSALDAHRQANDLPPGSLEIADALLALGSER